MELENAIRESALPNKDDLIKLIKQGIFLNAMPIDPAKQALGESCIGGFPDLPEQIEWPFSGKYPLAFVAQINLTELPDHPVRKLLPNQGMLYFFYEPVQDFNTEVLPPGHSFFKVLYQSGPLSDIKPRLPPQALADRWRFRPSRITFTVKETFPALLYDGFSSSIYDEIAPVENRWDEWDRIEKHITHGHQMLGHPRVFQNYIEYRCESERLKLDNPQASSKQIAQMAETGFRDWELLLQVHSDLKLGIDWPYDLASTYFMIWRQDLRERNFDRTWFVYQDH